VATSAFTTRTGQAEFDTIAGGTHVDTKAVTVYPQGGDMPGTVIGDIKGDKIHLKITREGVSRTDPAMILDGQVGPDNRGHGTYTYKGGDPGSWDSIQELKCVPAAPPPQAQPEPEQPKPLAPDSGNTATAPTPAPQQAASPTPGPNQSCIPDPFDLNFPGAC
jgi:hypothetical protein